MIAGQQVRVFTASGTFSGETGEVVALADDGAIVRVEGERAPLYFTTREIVPVQERALAGAE